MKKHIATFILFCLWSFTVSAQLKVAILEPVDKGQNVSYGVKLLLRSSLTSSISNTPGYEGYDRVDMASIAGEQDFQRTGNVSDSQIKQLGVATGAAYVLVAEAAKYDATSIIITAKIIDVETFGVKSSAVQVSGISADEMQNSCANLSAKLLGVEPPASTQTQNTIPATQPATIASSAEMKFLGTSADGSAIYVATQDEPKRMNHSDAINACACKGEGWRLPTTPELLFIDDQKEAIGGFNRLWKYWGLEDRQALDMTIGGMMPTFNSAKCRVRCVKEVKQ